MRLCGQHRQASFPQGCLGRCHGGALARALCTRCLEIDDRGGRSCRHRRRQRRREDESGSMGSDCIHERAAAGDVAAKCAESFCKRSLDDVDARHHPLSLGDPGAAWPVHANGVHFVEIGHRVIALRKVADHFEWGYIAVHRIHALEYDQLRAAGRCAREQQLQLRNIVVAPYLLGTASGTHAFDHRVVIVRIG